MRVLLHRSADKYLDRLNIRDQERINAALDELEQEPPEGDIRPVILKPLLTHLADDYWKPVVEPASPDESVKINERAAEYEKDPSSFVPRKTG